MSTKMERRSLPCLVHLESWRPPRVRSHSSLYSLYMPQSPFWLGLRFTFHMNSLTLRIANLGWKAIFQPPIFRGVDVSLGAGIDSFLQPAHWSHGHCWKAFPRSLSDSYVYIYIYILLVPKWGPNSITWPYWIIVIPNILGSTIPYNHQPTGVVTTAHLYLQR